MAPTPHVRARVNFWTILTDFMRWATQHKISGLDISQTLILNPWPDPDLARDLKIQIETDHWKHLIMSFRLPPSPCYRGYWFSSYRLGAFNTSSPNKWRVAKYASTSRIKPGKIESSMPNVNPRPGRAFSITRPGRGGGVMRPPWRFETKRFVALREKDQSIALDEYSRLVVYFFTLGQHLT